MEHNHETVGPRPELVEEMMLSAGVHFYMYTTPRFLKFAQQFLSLNPEASKKAASEFEKIEKQERRAEMQTEISSFPQYDWQSTTGWIGANSVNTLGWDSYTPINTTDFTNAGWSQPSGEYRFFPSLEPVKTEYLQLLPLNGHLFHSKTGKWKAEIVTVKSSPLGDLASYVLKFDRGVFGWATRELRIHVELAILRADADWRYKSAIRKAILEWLESGQDRGELNLGSR